MKNKKIKLAIVTQYGLDTGGTEKFLQTIATFLPKDKFSVDYYYIATNKKRISSVKEEQLKEHGVSLLKYSCQSAICKFKYYKQVHSNFFNVYKDDYDLILSGGSGIAEEPFTFIHDTPILQSIHYVDGADNQYNIARVLNISKFSENMWVKKGGDRHRSILISHPIYIPPYKKINIRNKFNISSKTFIYGFHQRNNDKIYSAIPLKAYSKIENDNTAFIICGGSRLYRKQAKALKLKNCFFIPATDNNDMIYSFLETIDVYAHGRKDGELNSTALAEAMYFGLPIVTHPSNKYNGHLEVVKQNGFIANSIEEYADDLSKLNKEKNLYEFCSKKARIMFKRKYDLNNQMNKFIEICEDTIRNPYPFKNERFIKGKKSSIEHFIKRNLIKITKKI